MHVRFDKKRREFLFCTNRHLLGKEKCPNARRLPVEFAERAFIHAFEEALAGALVMEKLEEVLEQQRRAAVTESLDMTGAELREAPGAGGLDAGAAGDPVRGRPAHPAPLGAGPEGAAPQCGRGLR